MFHDGNFVRYMFVFQTEQDNSVVLQLLSIHLLTKVLVVCNKDPVLCMRLSDDCIVTHAACLIVDRKNLVTSIS